MKSVKLVVLFLLRTIGLFAFARYVTRYKLRILCYHGGQIGDEGRYNPLLFGSPHLIDKRLSWLLARGFTPLSIDSLDSEASISSIEGKKLPIIVTADDGWYSTISCVIEVCRRHSFPICVYVSTRQLLSGLPVVPVVLGYLLWKSRVETFNARESQALSNIFGDKVYDLRVASERSELLRHAIDRMQVSGVSRKELVDLLESFASVLHVQAKELDLASRRFDYMTLEELKSQKALGCNFQLHGHVHHYPLGDPSTLEADVLACQNVLHEIGSHAPWHYCYPSGSFDENAVGVFNRVGVVTATTCYPGLVKLSELGSKMYLPRFLDGENVSQIEFEAEMSGVMSALRWCSQVVGLRRKVVLLGE